MKYFSRKSLETLILCIILVQPFLVLPFTVDAATWHVYSGQSIQTAIDAASEGDTIEVHPGTYVENLNVDKNLTIIGENNLTTIIDGRMNGLPAVFINASGVSIMNFTIQNATIGISIGENASASSSMLSESLKPRTLPSRTMLYEPINTNIIYADAPLKLIRLTVINKCNFMQFENGIEGYNTYKLNIDHCSFADGNDAIHLDNSRYPQIRYCTMFDMYRGLYQRQTWYSKTEHVDTVNAEYGFYDESGYRNEYSNCNAYGGNYGWFYLNTHHNYAHSIGAFDTMDDGFWIEGGGYNLFQDATASGTGGYGLDILNNYRTQIWGGIFHDNLYSGVLVGGSAYTSLVNIESYNNYNGIEVFQSPYFLMLGGNAHHNDNCGLFGYYSPFLTAGHSIYTDNYYGINLEGCEKVYLAGHVIEHNQFGVRVYDGGGSLVFSNVEDNYENGVHLESAYFTARHNNFVSNGVYGAYSRASVWSSPRDFKENYWGHSSGPYNKVWNPSGLGDEASDNLTALPFAVVEYLFKQGFISDWRTNVIPLLDKFVVIASDDSIIADQSPETFIPMHSCAKVGFASPLPILVDQFQQVDWRVIYPDQVTPKPLGCSAAWTSDWLASAFVTTELPDFVEGLDTNSSFVNQTTGEAIGDNGTEIITFGGPFVNPVVKRAENTSTPDADRAPVKFHSESGTFYFQYMNGTNIPNASLPASVINNDQDLFVIERYKDGDGRLMTISYGFGWPGTYAAGKYFDQVVFPDLETFLYSWIIVKWEDSNGDGFVNNPGKGDTYTLIAVGR